MQVWHLAIPAFLEKAYNIDTVSNSFIWFHSKNETINREVKLSFGVETMLISLSNWNLAVSRRRQCVHGAVLFVTVLTRSVSFLQNSSINWNLTR